MSEHKITLTWKRTSQDFKYESYNRDHMWAFDGGVEVPATAAPAYKGNPELVDPEEAFVASLSSCHMLTFLAVAAKKKFVVDSYIDHAVGHLEKNAEGKFAITRVELNPDIAFGGDAKPTPDDLHQMHDFAHKECFIANSVKTLVSVAGH